MIINLMIAGIASLYFFCMISSMTKITNRLGFSLIELLFTVGIIAILISITLPIYTSHIVKARRADAAIALTDLAGRMEQYYATENSYQDATLENLKINPAAWHNYYQLSIKASKDSYTLRATPIGDQAQKDQLCATLMLDQIGNQSISGVGTVDECWR